MDLWTSFWSGLAQFISNDGLFAVAVVVLLRSAAVPIPVPADFLVVVVGARARDNQDLLWPAWLVLAISTTVGAVLFYWFMRWIGHRDVSRFGRHVGLSTERIDAAETQLGERGTRAVIVARIVPGLRLAIVAVCGMLRFRWWKFVGAVALGAFIYDGVCLAIGYVFGDAVVGVIGTLTFPVGLLEPVVGLGILLFWLRRARRSMPEPVAEDRLSLRSRVRVGALAGALAIAGSSMLVNALLYLLAPVAGKLTTLRGVESMLTLSGGLAGILQLLLDSALLGIAAGIVYGLEEGHWAIGWSDRLRALALATLPFVLVMLVQLLIVLQLDRPPSTWIILGIGETIRWGAYGVLLGLIYPVLRTRRQQSTSEHQSTNLTKVMVESPGSKPQNA
jgi:membrane protein DedA with SNARE-associated domain